MYNLSDSSFPFACASHLQQKAMDMKRMNGIGLGCSSAATGDVVLEPHAKRHCSAAGVASTRLASEDTILPLDDCSASEYTLFGTPEGTESGGSPAGSVCDEDASTHDEYEVPSSSIVPKLTAAREPISYWHLLDYPSPTQMWGGDEIFDFGDTCAARSHGFAPEQEQADGLNMGSSLLGVCRDADSSEISPTVRFQPLSLEHRLLVSAVAELDPVPPVRCLRGIHIQRPWARMLLEGVKTVEIRSYPLTTYLNEDLWLIETSGRCRKGDPFKTRIIGIIRFGSHVQYNTATHFEADATAHRQEPRKWLQMAWKKLPTGVYGWRVASVQTLQEPQDPPTVKGIIGCKAISRIAV